MRPEYAARTTQYAVRSTQYAVRSLSSSLHHLLSQPAQLPSHRSIHDRVPDADDRAAEDALVDAEVRDDGFAEHLRQAVDDRLLQLRVGLAGDHHLRVHPALDLIDQRVVLNRDLGDERLTT